MKAQGFIHKYGDNVDTDVIIPARYLNTSDHRELASHCMEDIDKDFVKKVKNGDIMVGGWNFGCGSSREHAPIAIKASGISCIIAKSFARIFYRNAINIGLAIIESEEIADFLQDGDEISIDFDKGEIVESKSKKSFNTMPFPPFIQEIINANGYLNWIAKNKK
ncbi:3-isopropylmalate dehydratase small subunit [Helicobacter trogontum]|uniref:3-isopropylmalate dehydratase small subunit n=1 Tax=Helicobacter trogontum TaxID=50960 RepID=A0A4U8S8X5_9HELI|nr:3-isopropylmalate dehydratase small subunit [Helicobacter trogontum]TLD82458.1 3-isopropylmalate dehydratase small subunit [Helicobacter trogontum]